MPKTIINKVTNCQTIDFQDLAKYAFNDLKESKDRDVSKLKNNIVNTGFTSPFYIWQDHKYVIDGAGRCKALTELQSEGFIIPPLPYVEIQAQDLKEAKKIVLSVSSQFGIVTQNSLGDFTANDFEIEELKELKENELNLPELDILVEGLDLSDDQDLDYSDKNKEIDLDNLGNESSLVFKLSHQTYLQVLDLLNNAKGKLELDTNEEVLLQLLSDYE